MNVHGYVCLDACAGEMETELKFTGHLLCPEFGLGPGDPNMNKTLQGSLRLLKEVAPPPPTQWGSGNTRTEEALALDPTHLVRTERQSHFCAKRRYRVFSHRKENRHCKASWFLPPPQHWSRIWTQTLKNHCFFSILFSLCASVWKYFLLNSLPSP